MDPHTQLGKRTRCGSRLGRKLYQKNAVSATAIEEIIQLKKLACPSVNRQCSEEYNCKPNIFVRQTRSKKSMCHASKWEAHVDVPKPFKHLRLLESHDPSRSKTGETKQFNVSLLKKKLKGEKAVDGSSGECTAEKEIDLEKHSFVSDIQVRRKKGKEDRAIRKLKKVTVSGWQYVRSQFRKLTKEDREEVSRRYGKCARSVRFNRCVEKTTNSEKKTKNQEQSIESLKFQVGLSVPASAKYELKSPWNRSSRLTINDKIQTLSELKMQFKRVCVGISEIHGIGLHTLEDVGPNEFVIEFTGEVIRSPLADIREKLYERKGIREVYMFSIDDYSVVDATRRGGPARFINHSCDPNLSAKIMTVRGGQHIVFHSNREIPKFQELTYDYKFDIEGEDQKIECLCRSSFCRKYLN